MSNKRDISNFLENEYKNFAMYVIEGRAVPSVIDGFKPSQRKVIHASRKAWRNEDAKPMKIFQLTGLVASTVMYHHGDQSLNNTIITMAQKFKNNLPLLEEVGQFGSLRSPEAGAPRYIGTKLTSNFNLIYKDNDLLTPKFEEGYEIEPEYFLPIIPTILCNGGSGLAVGYASNILNRNPTDVINACLNILKDKKISKLKPFINEFNGTYELDKDKANKWNIYGKFERVNTSTIRITEIPPSMTYEKWEAHLDKLVENRQIVSYDDSEGIDYTIKMTRADLEKLDNDGIISLFKLKDTQTEHFTTLDEKGKLKIFESAEEIIKYFVEFRLTYYTKRKEHQVAKILDVITGIDNRMKFIQYILEDKIIINKKSKSDIEKQLNKSGISKRNDSYDYLLSLPINSLSKEKFEELKALLKDKKEELKLIKSSVPKETYIKELEELKTKIK